MQNDEQLLIEGLKRRDPAVLSRAFGLYSDKIYRLAVSLLHDEQQADGVVQDTFLKLIERIDGFDGRSAVGTWLYRVAYNECLMRLRAARPQVELEEPDDLDFMPGNLVDWRSAPDRAVSSAEALAEMERAIATLSPALRAVFLLRDVEGMSTVETAQSLDIAEATVKVRLHRARLTLRERLSDYFQEWLPSEKPSALLNV